MDNNKVYFGRRLRKCVTLGRGISVRTQQYQLKLSNIRKILATSVGTQQYSELSNIRGNSEISVKTQTYKFSKYEENYGNNDLLLDRTRAAHMTSSKYKYK